MIIWTGQISQWRFFKENNIEVLNIALKGGEEILAPTRWMLINYRANIVNRTMFTCREEEYSYLYLELLRTRYQENQEYFKALVSWLYWHEGSVALVCYCRSGHFCHRNLLIDILLQIGESMGMRLNFKGEHYVRK